MRYSNTNKSELPSVETPPTKPTKQELANIGNSKRVFVANPQVADYDSMFDGQPISVEPPRYYKRTSDTGTVVWFFIIVAIVFLSISFLLGTLL